MLRRSLDVRRVKYFSTKVSNKNLFNKILIANRGEIACRVIKTAKRLGVQTVAVYSDADRHSQHVKLADEAVYIGAAPAAESYLVGQKIIQACKDTGAQAVHPGYGFLSENLSFCELCVANDIVFIGPGPRAIKAMGSKSESKEIMIRAGVPVTPGYHGADNSDATLQLKAAEVGYPLMIKAVSGGGGKGMRSVSEPSSFLAALQSCRREALKSFKDDQVLIERLVRAPRHVEVQVFGDSLGGAVHLYERDCSVQRRHQKVLEEAPGGYHLPPATRKAMGQAAVACVQATGYMGAGTVEFLVDSLSDEFFFCEMNTRLQVEHPVTELLMNGLLRHGDHGAIDLVEWQLRIASGQALPLDQAAIDARLARHPARHAIEARIYAENPMKGFLPSSGPIAHLACPGYSGTGVELGEEVEEGVRVDSGILAGDLITTNYDPMLAKLIVVSDDGRPAALAKLARALQRFQVSGLANNIDFLQRVVLHPAFLNPDGDQPPPTTAFFDQHLDGILASLKPVSITQLPLEGVLGLITAALPSLPSPSTGGGPRGARDLWAAAATSAVDGDDNEFAFYRPHGQPVVRTLPVLDPAATEEVAKVEVQLAPHGHFTLRCLSPSSSNSKEISGRVLSRQLVRSQRHVAVVGGRDNNGPPMPAAQLVQVYRTVVELAGQRQEATVVLQHQLAGEGATGHSTSSSTSSMIETAAVAVDVWLTAPQTGHYSFTLPSMLQVALDETEARLAGAGGGAGAGAGNNTKPSRLVSPMPGKIVKVLCEEGAMVKQGDVLVILEAMKMEHSLTAPHDGSVAVFVQEGGTVSDGMKLVEVHRIVPKE